MNNNFFLIQSWLSFHLFAIYYLMIPDLPGKNSPHPLERIWAAGIYMTFI